MSIDLGAAIYIALKPLLKIYSIIFVGYLLARYDIISMEVARGISNMVINAILPCLTFNKIVTYISWKDIKVIGVLLLSALLLFIVGGSCSFITKLITPSPKKWFWGLLFAGIFPNTSDLPIAYMDSMGNGKIFTHDEANKGVAYSCIFLFAQSFMMMNFGLWRLIGMDFSDDDNDTEEDFASEDDLDKGSNSSSSVVDAIQQNIEMTTDLDNGCNFSTDAYELYSIDSNPMIIDSDGTDIEEFIPTDRDCYIQHTYHNEPVQAIDFSDIKKDKNHVGIKIFKSSSMANDPVKSHSIERFKSLQEISSHEIPQKKKDTKRRSRRSSMNDVIAEYSAVSRIKTGELNLNRPLALIRYLDGHNVTFGNITDVMETKQDEEILSNYGNESESSLDNKTKSVIFWQKLNNVIGKFLVKYHLEWLSYFLINLLRPSSLGAILGIICALIPWVKALFVPTYVHVHQAPDGQPVLNFFMDFTGYIGNACVPLGLLMLGGTLARLEVKSIPPGFIKTVLLFTVFRLVIIPIIGIAWANKLYELNWLDNDVSKFIVIITWSMPSATAQVYFTAFYSPIKGPHRQMDCLSIFFLVQYSILFITLSIVVSYTLKVDLKF